MAMPQNGLSDEFDLSDMNSTELARIVGNFDEATATQLFMQMSQSQVQQMQPVQENHAPHNYYNPVQQETEASMMYGVPPHPTHDHPANYGMPTRAPQPPMAPNPNESPFVEIIEQPKSRGLRFRYECEGRSAGSVPGENSTNEQRTYPTIKIHNYSGPAIIVVSCVTKETPPHCKPHPHAIVGRDCKKGVCTLRVKDTSDKIVFPNIGIQCAKKKDVEGALRLRKEINVDPFQTGFEHAQSNIDLNVVRLCFQVFLPNEQGKVTRVVPPVCSHAIHDKKSSKDLVICRVDKSSGKARGGDEVFLLCDKVNKEDIKIRFFEEADGVGTWEDWGDFGQGDVHRQYAIVFRTPPYHSQYITKPAEVQMQLLRPSDGEASESIPFTFMPEDPDPDRIAEKRKRKAQKFIEYWNSAESSDHRRGAGSSVRGRLSHMLKGARRIKKEPDATQGGSDTTGGAMGAMGGASASGDATMSHVTADNSSIGSVTVSSISASSIDSSVIAELSGLSSSDLSVVSNENGQLVISVSGGEGSGLSVDSINLPPNMLSGELMNQIDIQQLNAYLQGGNEILLSQPTSAEQAQDLPQQQQQIHHHQLQQQQLHHMETETEATLRQLNQI